MLRELDQSGSGLKILSEEVCTGLTFLDRLAGAFFAGGCDTVLALDGLAVKGVAMGGTR